MDITQLDLDPCPECGEPLLLKRVVPFDGEDICGRCAITEARREAAYGRPTPREQQARWEERRRERRAMERTFRYR